MKTLAALITFYSLGALIGALFAWAGASGLLGVLYASALVLVGLTGIRAAYWLTSRSQRAVPAFRAFAFAVALFSAVLVLYVEPIDAGTRLAASAAGLAAWLVLAVLVHRWISRALAPPSV